MRLVEDDEDDEDEDREFCHAGRTAAGTDFVCVVGDTELIDESLVEQE